MTESATLVAGETLVDFIPDRSGPLGAVDSFAPRPGGAPANVAVAMTRLGTPPFFLSRVATDAFGDVLADRLAAEGVPTRFIERDDERHTTLAFVTHDADADRSFVFYRENAADAHVTPSTVPAETLATMDRVVLGGVLLTSDPGRTASFDLADRARNHDCTVVFDPNTRPELWSDDVDPTAILGEMLDRVDVVKTAADDFARYEYPSTPDRLTDRLMDHGPHTVVLTRGNAGSTLYATDDAPWGAGTWRHDGYPVDVVDTTGAGDAFLGGFLAAVEAAPDAYDSSDTPDTTDVAPGTLLGFANAVAALTTTGEGAWTALPDREAVATFQARHD